MTNNQKYKDILDVKLACL